MFCRLTMPYDEAAVLDLAEMQVRETLPHLDFDRETTRATFRDSIVRADPTIFVVEDNGELLGYLVAQMKSYLFTRGHLASQEVIYVKPGRRGSRAAPMLIKSFRQWAKIIGAREAYMGIANGFRPDRTARLFSHYGFAPVGQYLRWVPPHDAVLEHAAE